MTDSVNTRELALMSLIEINEKGQYSHLVLRQVLDKYQYLSKQDRAFISRLVEGTLEYQIKLDYIIDSFSKTKVSKMKPFIRNLLRMSIYQMKYMDSVPDSAVCNEAVKLAKRHKFGQLSGFVNGVLRNISRQADTVKFPGRDRITDYLSIEYSMPKWLVEKFEKQYGDVETEEILKGFQRPNTISIRVNTSQISPDELKNNLEAEGVSVYPVIVDGEKLEYAFVISGFDYISKLESFQKGLFYIQDVSSMMVAEAAGPKEGDYVIDVCAAPGGKSTHIAELLKGSGHVDARDLTDYKVSLIEDNIARCRLDNIDARVWDARVLDRESVDKADVLVCDLPCSGIGVLGRKKDIRYKINEEQLEELVELQRQILDTVYCYVKPQGKLIYSTCTINRDENEDNIKWFLDKYPQFCLVEKRQMLPGQVGNDGFFIAELIRSR